MPTPETDRTDYEAFVQTVRRYGLAAMARQLKVSTAMVCELMAGKRRLRGAYIRRIAEVLHTPADQVLAVNRHSARLGGYDV